MLASRLEREHSIEEFKQRYSYFAFVAEAAKILITDWETDASCYKDDEEEEDFLSGKSCYNFIIDKCSNNGVIDYEKVVQQALLHPKVHAFSEILQLADDTVSESMINVLDGMSTYERAKMRDVAEFVTHDADYDFIRNADAFALTMVPLLRMLTFVSKRKEYDGSGSWEFEDAPETSIAFRVHLLPPENAKWIFAFAVDSTNVDECAILYNGPPELFTRTGELMCHKNVMASCMGTTHLIVMLWTYCEPNELLDAWLDEFSETIAEGLVDSPSVYGLTELALDSSALHSVGWSSAVGVIDADELISVIREWPDGSRYLPMQ
jgi:hypothetical protein